MDTRLRVSIQSAKLGNLSKGQQRFLNGLADRLERADLRIMPSGHDALTIDERLERVRRSHGMLILAFRQWEGHRVKRDAQKSVIFPSEFTHISAVMAVAAERPLLVLREKPVTERGVLRRASVHPIITLPNSLDPNWLDTQEFVPVFAEWLNQVKLHRHVFLGYSSQATSVADLIYKYLNEQLELRVFDWRDFQPADEIWKSIERAERLTNAGIFLFMSDDAMAKGNVRQFAPRDNVVYEAGYFAGAKGRAQTLIIREKGAKLPTDLNGMLHLEIEDRKSIAVIETQLRKFIENCCVYFEEEPGPTDRRRPF